MRRLTGILFDEDHLLHGEALSADPTKALKVNDVGTMEKRKWANIVVYDKNTLDDIPTRNPFQPCTWREMQ